MYASVSASDITYEKENSSVSVTPSIDMESVCLALTKRPYKRPLL